MVPWLSLSIKSFLDVGAPESLPPPSGEMSRNETEGTGRSPEPPPNIAPSLGRGVGEGGEKTLSLLLSWCIMLVHIRT